MALAPCPECNHMVSRSAACCPRCGAVPKRFSLVSGCAGITTGCAAVACLAVVGCLGLVVMTSTNSSDRRAPVAATLIAGDVATLDDGDTVCALAVDDEAWEEMLDLQNARGSLAPLVEAGRVFPAARGSRVKVIDRGYLSLRVQLLDGPFAGKLGWIQREFVRANTR